MANLTLSIGGRPLKIQCSDQNIERVKEVGSAISELIENEKKENVPFLTSALIAYLKSMEEILKKKNFTRLFKPKLFYESRIQELKMKSKFKSDLKQIFEKIHEQISIE